MNDDRARRRALEREERLLRRRVEAESPIEPDRIDLANAVSSALAEALFVPGPEADRWALELARDAPWEEDVLLRAVWLFGQHRDRTIPPQIAAVVPGVREFAAYLVEGDRLRALALRASSGDRAARAELDAARRAIRQVGRRTPRAEEDGVMPGLLSYNGQGSAWARGERIYRPQSEWSRIRARVAEGKRLLLSQKPDFMGVTHAQVGAGKADAKLEEFRKQLVANVGTAPFWIAWHHEPEDDTEFSAFDFRLAFRRFVDKVVRPIPNASSVLCMMREIYCQPGKPYDRPEPRVEDHAYDPGEAYVDVYAGDPYNPWLLKPTYKWRELEWLTEPMRGYAAARGRPCAVWETGCQNDPRKPAWIKNAGLYARDAKLIHLSFFKGTGPRGTWDAETNGGGAADAACVAELDALARRKYFQVA